MRFSRFLKRKAQISQVFSYLMAILVVGIIVYVGFKGVGWIMSTNCENSKASFQKQLFELIDDYSDRGSTRVEMLSAPCDVTKVCLADLSFCEDPDLSFEFYDFNEASLGAYLDQRYHGVILSSVQDCNANVFTVGKTTDVVGYAPKLVLNRDGDYPFKCFDVRSGKIKFLFKGSGKKTQVEPG